MSDLPSGRWFWWRWSLRDLRSHWVAVVAIAIIVAIGVGVYAGLGSTATWRRVSNDASFETLAMHDLRVSLSPGTFTDEGTLSEAIAGIDGIDATMERIVVDSQVEVGAGAAATLAQARVVGMDLAPTAGVDRLWVAEGSRPDEVGTAGPVGVLEAKFADALGLPSDGSLIIAGGQVVRYSGLGMIPEDFYYEGPEGTILSHGDMAPIYLPLTTAQSVSGRPNQVNELVITLDEGADPEAVVAELSSAIESRSLGAVITSREDEFAVRVLYDDIETDQRFWNALAGLVFAAAALGAFNLINRIVEAQRREIGIGMALGVPRRFLAIRPMLIGAEVAVIGVIGGVGVGLLVADAMRDLLASFLPLPDYRTPFQIGFFAQAALVGAAVPLVASAIPTIRAVSVEPIEAIQTGHLHASASRTTDWTGRLRLPGSTFAQMPLRNVMRTPRRTILTALGVGAAVTALVGVLGLLDSFGRSIDDVSEELAKGDPDRLLVQFDTFYPEDSPSVTAISALSEVGDVDTGLRLPAVGLGEHPEDDLDLLVELVDFDSAQWTPTITDSSGPPEDGIVLAAKAAADLGVEVGDMIDVRHPRRTDTGGFALVESSVVVSGIQANPMRTFAFMDRSMAPLFGLEGAVNFAHVHPHDGVEVTVVQRAMFGLPGVASTQGVTRIGEGFDEALGQFVGILVIAAVAVMVLALLIAFNGTRITIDERRREHATMRAFGLPVRTIMRMVIVESMIIGVLATIIGVVVGAVFVRWMLQSLATTTLPDLGITSYIAPTTMLSALVVGVLAVSIAPLFLVRRLATMSVPDTLRVME